MKATPPQDALPETLLGVVRSLVRREEQDLNARKLAVFLICYLDKGTTYGARVGRAPRSAQASDYTRARSAVVLPWPLHFAL